MSWNVNMYVCMYIYIYIYTYIHTYIHTHTWRATRGVCWRSIKRTRLCKHTHKLVHTCCKEKYTDTDGHYMYKSTKSSRSLLHQKASPTLEHSRKYETLDRSTPHWLWAQILNPHALHRDCQVYQPHEPSLTGTWTACMLTQTRHLGVRTRVKHSRAASASALKNHFVSRVRVDYKVRVVVHESRRRVPTLPFQGFDHCRGRSGAIHVSTMSVKSYTPRQHVSHAQRQ
jgi:hypothetical protein